VFYVGDIEYMSRTAYRGLPQESVLSSFLSSLLGSGVDRFILQYADEVVVYDSQRIMENARALVQTACLALKDFFDMVGLTISAVKSEAMVFSRKHHKPDVTLWIDGRRLPFTKYPGVFFDSGLRWNTQVMYVQRRCLQRLNFTRSIAGTWLRAHPRCMLLLYKGLVGSILDFASECYSEMARTHFLKLERLQYRSLRIAFNAVDA
jgi:hypothetical protein